MKISEDKKTKIALIIFGIYLVLLLWLTVFSRNSSGQVYVFYPFKTYIELFNGDTSALFYIFGNILLFVPIGYFAKPLVKKNCIISTLIGFGVSLIIELIQLFTKRGCFEFDDLMHNSIGTFIGCLIYKRFPLSITYNIKNFIVWTFSAAIVTSAAIFSIVKISDYINYQYQVSFAAMGDGNGKKNLLLMDCKDTTTSDGNISLTYQDDGTIHITGTSDDSNWIRLGQATLEPGTYSFTGYSEASWKTIAIYLEYNENSEIKYQLISSNSSTTFTLTSMTDVTAHMIAYKDYNCDVIARPVIYKEQ